MPDDAPGWIAAVLVATLSVARLARLATEDSWPPASRLRNWWVQRFNGSEWSELAVCPFCMAPWIAVAVLGAGWLSDLHPLWWAFNGWLSVSYVAAMVVARDIPGGE
jgi:hypothetical protein